MAKVLAGSAPEKRKDAPEGRPLVMRGLARCSAWATRPLCESAWTSPSPLYSSAWVSRPLCASA
ncbi:MAG: hypothetical protein LBQ12_10550 [Deltaproteobacteria bacterium]|nr:hypothetical protein [Deltaproteobacteria bacterium]